MDIKLEKVDMQICRICLQGIEPGHPIFHLNCPDSPNSSVTVQDKLIECVPEFNMNTVPNATICNECSQVLNSAYSFKHKCLQTEMRINKYLQQINATILHNLAEVWHNVGANKSIKVEELVIPDLKMEMDDGPFNDGAVVEDTDFKDSTQEILKDQGYTNSNCTDTYYSCYMCGYATKSNSDLSLHLQTHSDASVCTTMDKLTTDSNLKSKDAANVASLVPEKSKRRYNLMFDVFMKWCGAKGVAEITENAMMEYFLERSEVLKSPASLWCEYSMLNLTIYQYKGQDISQFDKLKAFLKQKNDGFQPRKSKVFTKEEIEKFLLKAPDEQYLMMKVVMIMGVAGACLTQELHKMKLQDLEFKDDVVVVRIPERRNRSFVIANSLESAVDWLEIIQTYIKLRPKNAVDDRLFFRYKRGRCLNQLVGRNKISKVPREIAKFLKLDAVEEYMGHSFRRSSASFLANT